MFDHPIIQMIELDFTNKKFSGNLLFESVMGIYFKLR
eukprot:UN09304